LFSWKKCNALNPDATPHLDTLPFPKGRVFSVGFRESAFQTVVARTSRPCHDSHGRDARDTTWKRVASAISFASARAGRVNG